MVILLFKTGDINSVSNYKLISLLPRLTKILEKIVADEMLHFLETENLLLRCQHGLSKFATETALTAITDIIYNNMDHKKISLLTLCDLSKAFDSVSYDILINKYAKVKIESWINSYISNRPQFVRLHDIASSSKHNLRGPTRFYSRHDSIQYICH